MRVYIKNLGCKSNRYESDKLAEYCQRKGVNVQFDDFRKSDIYIVNTCTVTHIADRKSRQAINLIKNRDSDAKIIIFGCGPRVNYDLYKRLNGVFEVCKDREKVINLLNEQLDLADIKEGKFNIQANSTRTRALIKIQDGCNNFCSYCIIPYSRGMPKSRPSDEIVDEINKKSSEGFKEIVITGINVNKYDADGLTLTGLLKTIVKKTDIPRIRLSSIEPMQVSEEFLEVLGNKRFCKHLHASLQSGSDDILKKMNRNYSSSDYMEMSKKLVQNIPGIALTTDIITGFPGETDENFLESINLSKNVGFSKIHVFKYSKRKGTKAAEMDDQISEEVKNNRSLQLREVSAQLRDNFIKSQIGKTTKVLFEKKNKDGFYEGLTGTYIKVYVNANLSENLINSIISVKLTDKFKDGLKAVLA